MGAAAVMAGAAGAGLAASPLLVGGLTVAGGAAAAAVPPRRPHGLLVAGVLLVVGVWSPLLAWSVAAPEPYLAPVSAGLLAAGVLARRRGALSSWVAYVPALLVLALPALAERVAGGGGVHALVAGAAATLAVLVGGWRRLGGSLVAGSALLVTVVAHETLATLASVPTWAWLALGGATLVAAGMLLERAELTPADARRRFAALLRGLGVDGVDPVGDPFDRSAGQ